MRIKDIMNKFVGMNDGTRRRTVTAFIVAVADVLAVFNIIEFSDEQLNAIKNLALMIVTAFVWAYCSHYKNNDYTQGSVHGTGITRQIKLEQNPNYIGERFYTNEFGDLLTDDNKDYTKPEEVDGDVMAVEEALAEMKIAEEEKESKED